MANIWNKQQEYFKFAPNKILNIVVFGVEKTGKTSFLEKIKSRYIHSNITINFYECHDVEDIFEVYIHVYIHNIFFFFDITKEETLDNLAYQRMKHLYIPILLIANKIDLPDRFLTISTLANYSDIVPMSVYDEINVMEPITMIKKSWEGKEIPQRKLLSKKLSFKR